MMNVRIKAVNFDMADRLNEFIDKKAARIQRRYPDITDFDVTLKVVKPETALNKEVTLKTAVPGMPSMVADKTANSFEEALDACIEAIERRLERSKDR